jgi:hypothetical protein
MILHVVLTRKTYQGRERMTSSHLKYNWVILPPLESYRNWVPIRDIWHRWSWSLKSYTLAFVARQLDWHAHQFVFCDHFVWYGNINQYIHGCFRQQSTFSWKKRKKRIFLKKEAGKRNFKRTEEKEGKEVKWDARSYAYRQMIQTPKKCETAQTI